MTTPPTVNVPLILRNHLHTAVRAAETEIVALEKKLVETRAELVQLRAHATVAGIDVSVAVEPALFVEALQE